MVGECGHEHVAVQPSQHHGRGLFATRAFAPGEVSLRVFTCVCIYMNRHDRPFHPNSHPNMARRQVILRERPLVALQSLDNRQYVPCCGGCFHFLGSARHHLMVRGCTKEEMRRVGLLSMSTDRFWLTSNTSPHPNPPHPNPN